MNRKFNMSNNFRRICCKASIFLFRSFDQFLALGRVSSLLAVLYPLCSLSCGGTGGFPVLRCHVGFYIWPGVADEGAGGALKGLSVSGHVLGEIVLKIFLPWVCDMFFPINSPIIRWFKNEPIISPLPCEQILSRTPDTCNSWHHAWLHACEELSFPKTAWDRTRRRKEIPKNNKCFQDCTGWPSSSQVGST